MREKQVASDHYEFSEYMDKRRWASMWHQLDEVLALRPERVLEIGPGPGVFKALGGVFGVAVETLDLDPDLAPDHVAPAEAMPFADDAFDVVCAFQMLEHVPYEAARTIFAEMCRVARTHVVISLPDARSGWPVSLHVPRKGDLRLILPRPRRGPPTHVFDGQHYWELNTRGHAAAAVGDDLARSGGVRLVRQFPVKENPYHRFLVFAIG